MADIRALKDETKKKKLFKSYNPSTDSREINPYWKCGGIGIPQSADEQRKSESFMKPNNEGYYKSESYATYDVEGSNRHCKRSNERRFKRPDSDREYYRSSDKREPTKKERDEDSITSSTNNDSIRDEYRNKSYNWRRGSDIDKQSKVYEVEKSEQRLRKTETITKEVKSEDGKYLCDEKMNKLAAKLIKAEIMGDTALINDLKSKLEGARQYRKDNPNAGNEFEDHGIMLTSTSSTGSSRPLSKPSSSGDNYRKRKLETHRHGERMKYFGNDDKFTLSQMVEEEKYGDNYNNDAQLARAAEKHKNPNDDLDDIFMSEISKNVKDTKEDARARQKAIDDHNKINRTLEGCEYCIDSKNMIKHLMVSCGNKVYLTLPARKSIQGHCIITTLQHSTCVTALDEDVWEEIMDYRKALTQYYNSLDLDVVFFETATNLNRYPHMVINCVALPRDVGDTAPIYFKKALLECEAEWAMNKKIIDLEGKNIRKGVPKGLPYFWIDFGMDPGFAHVIEDQRLFPKNFAQEIIGGILDLDHSFWKKPQREHVDQQRKKTIEFLRTWKPFDTLNKKRFS